MLKRLVVLSAMIAVLVAVGCSDDDEGPVEPAGFTLRVTTVGNGTVQKSPDQSTYAEGDTVTLTAMPGQNWSFDGWSGGVSGTANPATLVMQSDQTVTATFSSLTQTITLTPTKDNTLYESPVGEWSNGKGQYLFFGRTSSSTLFVLRRGLMHFEVAGNIPASATIDSVSLTIKVSKLKPGAADTFVNLHVMNADWGEGESQGLANEGGGAASEQGDATWIHTFFDTDMWTTAGGDYEPVASATQTIAGLGSYKLSSQAMRDDVQSWLDTPAQNFGWIAIGDESGPTTATARRFDSKDHLMPANAPMLTIHYRE